MMVKGIEKKEEERDWRGGRERDLREGSERDLRERHEMATCISNFNWGEGGDGFICDPKC
jgi:hypothetical protein